MTTVDASAACVLPQTAVSTVAERPEGGEAHRHRSPADVSSLHPGREEGSQFSLRQVIQWVKVDTREVRLTAQGVARETPALRKAACVCWPATVAQETFQSASRLGVQRGQLASEQQLADVARREG